MPISYHKTKIFFHQFKAIQLYWLVAENGEGNFSRSCLSYSFVGIIMNLRSVDEIREKRFHLLHILQLTLSHEDRIALQTILMVNIQDVIECAILLHRDLYELLEESRFGYSERLCQNNVVSVSKYAKRIFHEVNGSTLKIIINTEQIDDNCILCLTWHFRNTLQILQALHIILVRIWLSLHLYKKKEIS